MEAEDNRRGGAAMTDEQWKIVNELRMLALGHGGPCCAEAANEIERLAKEVARLKDENGVLREQCQNMLDMMVR
jgi:hypothetical protein